MTTRPGNPEDPSEGERATVREMLGAHALGLLSGRERAVLDDHLAGCAGCREELATLRPLAAALGDLDPDVADRAPETHPDLEPSADKLAAILAGVRRRGALSPQRAAPPRLVPLVEAGPLPVVTGRPAPALDTPTLEVAPTAAGRAPDVGRHADPEATDTVRPLRRPRRPVPRIAVAAAGLVLALAGVGVGLGAAGPLGLGVGPAGESVAVRALDPDVSASADLVAHTWGVEMKLVASGSDPGATYRVAVLDTGGRPVDAGAFVGTGSAEMLCRLTTSLLRPDATGFVVTDPAGAQVLASRFT